MWKLEMCSVKLLGIVLVLVLFFVTVGRAVDDGHQDFCGTEQFYCLLRDKYYPKELWNFYAGYYCYIYTNSARLYIRYNTTTETILCRNIKWDMWLAEVDDENNVTAVFDYTNQTAMRLLRGSFKNDDVFNNYLSCCEDAALCCQDFMDNDNIIPTKDHCPVVWDGWSCFPQTEVNTTARLPCSSQAYQSPDVCYLESEKYCLWDGGESQAVWEIQTNYNFCTIAEIYRNRHTFHVIALGACIVLCMPAIVIFLSFVNLRRSTRVALHRNLLIAVCVRNVLTILSKIIVILDALKSSSETNHVMENNSVSCRILAFFENSAKNAIYACMLIDGWYLHRVIVRAFARKIQSVYLYIALAGLALVPSLIWATAMGLNNMDSCWMVYSSGLQWIVDGYRIAILAINTVLLVDIIRVMCMKLNQGGTDRKTKMALRATLFLIPLFGIHIVCTAKKITYDDSCTAEDIYDYSRYAMEALQGIWVAILFCYINSEVHDEIRNGYRKLTISLDQRYGWNLGKDMNDKRRATTATYVQPGSF